MMALFKTDGRGRESLIRSFEIEFPRNVESSARYDYENFVNYISFTPQGNPVFAFAGMFRSQLDWVFIGGRKYEPKEGDFGFLLYDQHGEISWAYFAATRTTGVYTTSYDRIGQLLRTRMTATYYQQDHWLFCIPDSTGWEHFGGYTTLNEKNDMRVFALDTRGERVTWSIKAPLSYRYGPVNNQLLGYDDSTLLLAGLSTEPLNNFFRPYNVVYKFNIQSSPPKVHIYAIAEPSSVSTDGPFLNITVTDEQPVSIPLELIIRDANGTTVVDSSFATTEKGEQHFLFDMKTWKQGSYSVHVYDQRNNDLVAILVQKK